MTVPHDIHALRVAPLRTMERLLLLEHTRLDTRFRAIDLDRLRYALALARMERITAEHRTLDLFEEIAPFRHWLIEQLEHHVDAAGERPIDWAGLARAIPEVMRRVGDVRTHLLERHVGELSETRFEHEIRHRQLVLVLGGGGGAGYPHLGVFAILSELGLVPKMIVGSSMGAMLGLFRASMRHYDPLAVAVALPRPSEAGRLFSPYSGVSRFGFPGTFELNLRAVATDIFRNMLAKDLPTLAELPIPLRPVVTGLRTGVGVALGEVESEITRSRTLLTPLALRRRSWLLLSTIRRMVQNPRMLSKITFGHDEEVRDYDAVDAVGFSCAVPGILHYDIHDPTHPSMRTTQRLMESRQLFRLTDGGVVSNVASETAWQCVQAGEIQSRNAFILSFDAFAPGANANALYFPVQRLIREQVLSERVYADYHHTYRSPLAAVQVLANLDDIQSCIAKVRKELDPLRTYLARSLQPLPRWSHLQDTHSP